jgi:hypothetical protein
LLQEWDGCIQLCNCGGDGGSLRFFLCELTVDFGKLRILLLTLADQKLALHFDEARARAGRRVKVIEWIGVSRESGAQPRNIKLSSTEDAMGHPARAVILGAGPRIEGALPWQVKNDLSRSLVALEQNHTIIAVIELSLNSWLVAGIVPGVKRHPLKKLSVDEKLLLQLLYRWRDEAVKAGHMITRMAVAFEAGRDGFWLARWLRARGIEAYVIHPTSVAVPREHRRAKTDPPRFAGACR